MQKRNQFRWIGHYCGGGGGFEGWGECLLQATSPGYGGTGEVFYCIAMKSKYCTVQSVYSLQTIYRILNTSSSTQFNPDQFSYSII